MTAGHQRVGGHPRPAGVSVCGWGEGGREWGAWGGLSRDPCDPGPLALCPQLTLLVVQVSILYYGGHLVISGQMTSGNLISFIIYEFVLGDCMEVRRRLGEGVLGSGRDAAEGSEWGRECSR